MSSERGHPDTDRTDRVLVALASGRRRSILATLSAASSPVSITELTTLVADVGETDHETVRTALVHRELPRLVDAGLVEWNRTDDVVETANHPALADRKLGGLLDVRGDEWDDVLECLSHGRRRVVLSILTDHDAGLDRRTLARRTLAAERDVPETSIPEDALEDVVASLHHVHLPKLRDAGLLVENGLETVRCADHPALDEESLTLAVGQSAATGILATD